MAPRSSNALYDVGDALDVGRAGGDPTYAIATGQQSGDPTYAVADAKGSFDGRRSAHGKSGYALAAAQQQQQRNGYSKAASQQQPQGGYSMAASQSRPSIMPMPESAYGIAVQVSDANDNAPVSHYDVAAARAWASQSGNDQGGLYDFANAAASIRREAQRSMRDFERETGATGATGYWLAAAEGDADDTYGSAATFGYSMAAAPQSRPGVGYDMAVAGGGNGDDLYNQSYTQAVATVPDSVEGVVVQLVDAKAKTSHDNAANLMLPGQALAVGNDNYADYQAGGRSQRRRSSVAPLEGMFLEDAVLRVRSNSYHDSMGNDGPAGARSSQSGTAANVRKETAF